MRLITTIPVTTALIIAGLSFGFSGKPSPGKKDTRSHKGFAVVELFTSEGCSSCPPADEVAIRISGEYPGNVYFLGFHVDYWDNIGWKDEFSNPGYTERQRKYARIFDLTSIYTPQVIINGIEEGIGSKEAVLRKSISRELKKEVTDSISLRVKVNGENIGVSYDVSAPKLLNIALVQLKATTNVKRGENAGHHLNHINIVRVFKTLDTGKATSGTIPLTIPGGLTTKEIKVIAYLQDKTTFQVTGAAEASLQ